MLLLAPVPGMAQDQEDLLFMVPPDVAVAQMLLLLVRKSRKFSLWVIKKDKHFPVGRSTAVKSLAQVSVAD